MSIDPKVIPLPTVLMSEQIERESRQEEMRDFWKESSEVIDKHIEEGDVESIFLVVVNKREAGGEILTWSNFVDRLYVLGALQHLQGRVHES